LQSIAEQTRERATDPRLVETLSAFLAPLREAVDTLDILKRQRIVRLVIKEVLVGDDSIVIHHCIPVPPGPPDGSGAEAPRTPSCVRVTRAARRSEWVANRTTPRWSGKVVLQWVELGQHA
jgi:site-specific DNA recombinase